MANAGLDELADGLPPEDVAEIRQVIGWLRDGTISSADIRVYVREGEPERHDTFVSWRERRLIFVAGVAPGAAEPTGSTRPRG